MTIEKGDFIKISYTGKTEDGNVFDTTDEEIAKANEIYNKNRNYGAHVIIAGSGHIVQGLDEDIIGKDVGYNGNVTVPPEKGFGHRNPELIESIPLTKFDGRPPSGTMIQVDGRTGMVIRAIGRMAQVDFNTFLAGQTLIYDYEITEKIEDEDGKIKGIFNLYMGKEFPISINNEVLTVELEPEVTFNQRWLVSKMQIAREIINSTSIKEVVYLEKYNIDFLNQKKE